MDSIPYQIVDFLSYLGDHSGSVSGGVALLTGMAGTACYGIAHLAALFAPPVPPEQRSKLRRVLDIAAANYGRAANAGPEPTGIPPELVTGADLMTGGS